MPYGVCADCWSGAHEKCDGRCGCNAGHLTLTLTVSGEVIRYSLDGIGTALRCSAPGVLPFAVKSADEARDAIRSLFSKKAMQ